MVAAAGPRASPTNSLSPTRSGMTELMPFPHQTAVKPHISQQWLERSRSKLERQGHGPALDNLWSSDTLALYPIVSDEACERMSADRRVLQQIKNKQNIKSRHLAFYEAGTACFWVLYGCVLMTFGLYGKSDPSGDPTANGAGEQQQKQQQQQQRQSAHGTDTNGVIRATNTNGAIRAALASYAPPTAPYAPPSASYAPVCCAVECRLGWEGCAVGCGALRVVVRS